jgi:Restriction endonuclease NotI
MAPRTHPLIEVFGYPTDNFSDEATRHREKKLCPFNNKIPNCTKDKANDPLGTCCVGAGEGVAITCPIRFRENWIIADHGADFFFPKKAKWTSLTEVRLKDKGGKSAGNIDLVLVAYDDLGKVIDFGALEIQAVYISGNVRKPFEYFMKDPKNRANMNWKNQDYWPGPDYLSSSRKRLAPQLIFKGGIISAWKKKTAVALDAGFFATLPKLKEVAKERAEMAWLVYDLELSKASNRYVLKKKQTVYTEFSTSLDQITKSEPGNVKDFIGVLQEKLDEKLGGGGTAPDNQTIDQVV